MVGSAANLVRTFAIVVLQLVSAFLSSKADKPCSQACS
jgi:hypothetical protein